MKRLFFLLLIALFMQTNYNKINAQTVTDFENLVLPVDSFWNGSDSSGGFSGGNAWFYNKFKDWGSYTSWSGFAYSNKIDTTTQSYLNEYSAITGKGYNASSNYVVCYVSSFDALNRIKLSGIAKGDTVSGFYTTNSSYAYLTMKNGDAFAKKFGGIDGSESDWFALSVYGYKDGLKNPDSVLFYLADFRFANSNQDYIVKDWRWVDLTSLGQLDSIEFKMFSTDTVGGYINNPTYFCMDNLITNHNSFLTINEISSESFTIYPNPSENFIIINNFVEGMKIKVFDIQGQLIYNIYPKNATINISQFKSGIYMMEISARNRVFYSKFVKK